jgi:hypothetical protein
MKGRTEAPGHWKILRRRSSPGQVTGDASSPSNRWIQAVILVEVDGPSDLSSAAIAPGGGAGEWCL